MGVPALRLAHVCTALPHQRRQDGYVHKLLVIYFVPLHERGGIRGVGEGRSEGEGMWERGGVRVRVFGRGEEWVWE